MEAEKEKEPVASSDVTDKGKSPLAESSRPAPKKKRQSSKKRKPSANKVANIETRKRSRAWTTFKRVLDDEVSAPTAECIYCGIRFLCDSKPYGTSNMLGHQPKCPKAPHALSDPKQQILNFQQKNSSDQTTLVGSTPQVYNVKECRKAIAMFVIVDEQPFKVVEGEGFKYMMKRMQPKFHVPSRWTVARDCYKLFLEEKVKLKSLLKSNCARVCLTTDCWTSIQNLNYMVLTAHFIDDEWKLQKRIINFCQIPNHRGETIGKQVESCLNEWGLKKVFSVTVDNASSNDGAITYLKNKLKNWKGLVMEGECMHVRCCAHILNLVVNEGLKDLHASISAIRNDVRYVRSSPSRLAKFKTAIAQEHIEHQSFVCLDVPTRWNSIFLMLEAAEKFQKAFERLEDEDSDYLSYFGEDEKKVGPPTNEDWSNARVFIKFLQIFYEVTLSFSGSLYVTSNGAFPQLALVQSEIKNWTNAENTDNLLFFMATDMKRKYDKYWGNVENINPIIFIANVMDPRYKLAYITWSFEEIYGGGLVATMVRKVKADLTKLYDWYSAEYGKPNVSASQVMESSEKIVGSATDVVSENRILKARNAAFRSHLKDKDTIEAKNELEKYLNEPCVDEEDNYDVLIWWKSNASRFSILSKLARDVLAVPISTVASESAFSTSGRVLDLFRSSLSPQVAEALICTQNWLKPNKLDLDEFNEMLQQCEHIEKELANGGVQAESGSLTEMDSQA